MKNFPLALFTPIYLDRWHVERNADIFNKYLERWSEENLRDDHCASLHFHHRGGHENRLTYLEALALTQSEVLHPDMYMVEGAGIEIAEHAVHAVVEFYSRVQNALDIFRSQLKQIEGMPNGRIRTLADKAE